MKRYPAMKVGVAHGKASWMQEALEKKEASTASSPFAVIIRYHRAEEMWEHGNVMLGFDAEERMIQKLPQDFAGKVVAGVALSASRCDERLGRIGPPARRQSPEPLIARMMGGNAAQQFTSSRFANQLHNTPSANERRTSPTRATAAARNETMR